MSVPIREARAMRVSQDRPWHVLYPASGVRTMCGRFIAGRITHWQVRSAQGIAQFEQWIFDQAIGYLRKRAGCGAVCITCFNLWTDSMWGEIPLKTPRPIERHPYRP